MVNFILRQCRALGRQKFTWSMCVSMLLLQGIEIHFANGKEPDMRWLLNPDTTTDVSEHFSVSSSPDASEQSLGSTIAPAQGETLDDRIGNQTIHRTNFEPAPKLLSPAATKSATRSPFFTNWRQSHKEQFAVNGVGGDVSHVKTEPLCTQCVQPKCVKCGAQCEITCSECKTNVPAPTKLDATILQKLRTRRQKWRMTVGSFRNKIQTNKTVVASDVQ